MSGVVHHLALELGELGRLSKFERNSHTRNGIAVGTALLAGKYGGIHLLCQFFVCRQNTCPPGTIQGLVGGETDDVGMPDGAGHSARSYHPCNVRDVSQ